jgi:hypothetical protein
MVYHYFCSPNNHCYIEEDGASAETELIAPFHPPDLPSVAEVDMLIIQSAEERRGKQPFLSYSSEMCGAACQI